jgi:2-hydroxychromene-2-carboxylate isomerase
MTREATLYFDPISPYVYLLLADLERLRPDIAIRPVPILLAALLKHSGTKGPAEIPAKRLHTYRQCVWLARERNIPFRMPPQHPFNPLAVLRLLCALGPTLEQARIASRFVFAEGKDPSAPEGLAELGARLGATDAAALASAQGVRPGSTPRASRRLPGRGICPEYRLGNRGLRVVREDTYACGPA